MKTAETINAYAQGGTDLISATADRAARDASASSGSDNFEEVTHGHRD